VDGEIELTGGRVTGGVVRSADTVRRPIGPWTPTVHAYLRHLEERGFAGAPRVLGLDEQGREVLTFVEGVVPSASSWSRGHAIRLPTGALTDEALTEVARMIRSLHDASAGFVPVEPVWREHAYPLLPGEIVCHGDLGPHNTVYRDGTPVAFIDWDGARPNEALLELGQAAWWHVPLADDTYCREMGFEAPPDRGRRLRLFADAYGIGNTEFLEAVREAKQREAERPRYWPGMTASIVSEFLAHIVRELDWLVDHEAELREGLGLE
jgi:aminoglycoside phosphotransferase (APT) family kinase protein